MLRRWLIRSVFLLPVLLCVAGWGWSRGHAGTITCGFGNRSLSGHTLNGRVIVGWQANRVPHTGWQWTLRPWPKEPLLPTSWRGVWLHRGFDGIHEPWASPYMLPPLGTWAVTVHYYVLVLFFGALLLVVWRHTRPRPPGGAFPVEVAAKA